jgi:heme o synthase
VSRVVPNHSLDELRPGDGPADSTFRGLMATVYEASKPRIVRLVSVTSGVGFAMAAVARAWDAAELAGAATGALAGTALSAAGANALNQWMERDRDKLMPRTCARPMPQQRLSPGSAFIAGSCLAAGGVALLWVACGIVPASISLATVLIYLLIYTPLKPVTPIATLIGAVPGALPPLIGWSAAAGGNDPATLLGLVPLSLFAIMFVWQIPHFLAIAWMYREDYAAGGYRVLAVLDAEGHRTARSILLWSVLLVPTTMLPAWAMQGPAAWFYGVVAAALGIAFLRLGARFYSTRKRADARTAFIASVIHLPLVLVFLVACRVASMFL